MSMPYTFQFIDLFAGVGGFHLALHNLGGECVATVEIDINARKTYALNFQHVSPNVFHNNQFHEDITKIDGSDLPNHEILCGGFPCQAFSIAGHRKGFEDTRGTLFFDIARIIQQKQPPVVFLENVKNLKSHQDGRTLQVILSILKDLGYHVHAKVLNTCEIGGIPQNRERIFIVGFKDKTAYDNFTFPGKCEYLQHIDDILEQGRVDEKYYYNNKPLYDKLKHEVLEKNTFYQRRRQYVRKNKSGVCPTLTANMGTGGHNVPIILDNYGIRKLTPKETFLLQGFPKTFQLPNIADSHLYKQAGNAVTVTTVQRIAEKILLACRHISPFPDSKNNSGILIRQTATTQIMRT